MFRSLLLLTALAFFSTGCTPEDDGAGGGTAADAHDHEIYDVICGCALEEVGQCGEYIKIDGKWLELTGVDIGQMPFCKREGLKGHAHGEVKDGKYHATSFEEVE